MSEEERKKTPTEIEQFVQATLQSVFKSIDESNYLDMGEGALRWRVVSPMGGRSKPVGQRFTFEMPEQIHFDIAISVTEESSVNGGLDLKVAKFGANSNGENSTVSRVTFSIPITKNEQ